MTHDLWERVEPLLARVTRPSRYIDSEWGARHPESAEYRALLLYPDAYEVGQANQAIGILYDALNELPGVAAERCFVPWVDMADLMRAEGLPLFSLESCRPAGEFDLLGITLPYELTYTNVLEALDLAGVPLRAADRVQGDPLVIGGGPCVHNPEPVAVFFDAILIGEGEEAITEIVAAHREALGASLSRVETLEMLARVEGVYVPSFYSAVDGRMTPQGDAPPVVQKRAVSDLAAAKPVECPVVPFMDVVHDRVTVEVLRGCTRGCRFCQAGMVYRPVRERSADEVVRAAAAGIACTGYDEVSLTSLSSADHSRIEEILRRLTRRFEPLGVSVSLPSLRVDAFSIDLARIMASGKKTGLTFAPEAGTQRLRDVINKNVTEDELIATVRAAFSAGWRRVKLYFMIGLPTETDEDVRGIGELVARVLAAARDETPPAQRGGIRVGVSVSTFVPKAQTPFQWEAQITAEEMARRQSVLRESMPRKGVELSWHESEVSFLEGTVARGGREVADVIEAAWRAGARFDAWSEQFSLDAWRDAFAASGVDPALIANRERSTEETLPWSHLSAGVSALYLERERDRAYSGITTPDCSVDGCTGCDACDNLGVEIVLAGERR